MSGKRGGFSQEVRKGTNFAHVIEHVLLELIHLADPDKEIFTGWTREREDRSVYVIHYSAPDFLTGRLAAIQGVDLVKKLVRGERVNVQSYVDLLKDPMQCFTQESQLPDAFKKSLGPVSVIQELEEVPGRHRPGAEAVTLSEEQIENIAAVLSHIRRHLGYIVELWRASFLEYSGAFGKTIIDKIELLNIDKFIDYLAARKFGGFFQGVRGVSQVIHSYRIPINFVVYSIWLYKNRVMSYINQEYQDNKELLERTIRDFEDFYQVILQSAQKGFEETEPAGGFNQLNELSEFREMQERKGYILVVDDDEMIRSALRDILEYQGYWVMLAKDGAQALEIVSRKTPEVSLAILDLNLPNMRGEEVCKRIRGAYPGTKVLLMSGYLADNVLSALAHDNIEFIRKPFTTEFLMKTVRSLLDRD